MASSDHSDMHVVDPDRTPGWRAGLLGHLLRLDPEQRRTRFLGTIDEAGLRAHVARSAPLALVVFAPDGIVRGCAEVHRSFVPGEAEVAVSVETGWQNRGVGAALTTQATRVAQRAGLPDVRLICLRRNVPMLRIAQKLAAHALPMADWALALFRVEVAEAPSAP